MTHPNSGTLETKRQSPLVRVVAANVIELRTRAGMSQRQLATRLATIGYPIHSSSIAKIERGERDLGVDDLVALALALMVSPVRLLRPDGDVSIALTGGVAAAPVVFEDWCLGFQELPDDAAAEVYSRELPESLRERRRQEELLRDESEAFRAAEQLLAAVRTTESAQRGWIAPPRTSTVMPRRLRAIGKRAALAAEELAAELEAGDV